VLRSHRRLRRLRHFDGFASFLPNLAGGGLEYQFIALRIIRQKGLLV
jgi:hypothetical protein